MKKLLALLLSGCLSLGIFTAPAYASELPNEEQSAAPVMEVTAVGQNGQEQSTTPVVEVTAVGLNGEEVSPRYVKELWNSGALFFITSYKVRVQPQKGMKLMLSFGATDTVKISATKNGGWWPSKSVTYQKGSGTQTYDLIDNCNGEPYTLEFKNGTGCTMAAIAFETDVK